MPAAKRSAAPRSAKRTTSATGRRAAAKAPAAARRPAADSTVVLTGPPGGLRGTLTIANTGERRLAVRGVTVRRPDADDVAAVAGRVIRPGTEAAVEVTVPLARGTGPGEYAAQVEVAGVTRDVVLRVEAELSMRVSPRRVLAATGSSTVVLTVTNDGNIEVPLARTCRTHTSDGRPDPGPDLTLTITEAVTMGPASEVTLTATIEVPEDLDPSRRHHAVLPIGLADLDVIILPRDPR